MTPGSPDMEGAPSAHPLKHGLLQTHNLYRVKSEIDVCAASISVISGYL